MGKGWNELEEMRLFDDGSGFNLRPDFITDRNAEMMK